MSSLARSTVVAAALLAGTASATATVGQQPAASPPVNQILEVMKRATRFMVEDVSTDGGYVWTYLPDRSRRWGELEARATQIWIQPPGTATMGHLFLDAYHATQDEYYYRAAEAVAGALIRAQHPSGGWNYLADFAGERSLREWYDTVGRNAWRMEEFQHDWGNATFDDSSTAVSAKLLLRLYVEKKDPRYKPALDKALAFVLDSQYPIGAWPQRFPLKNEFSHHDHPDYTSYLTFNDGVAGENIDFLVLCHQALGDGRVRDAITRGMSAFLVTQMGPPQPGWALQYTPDLQPAAARTYEPKALATHTTAANVELLMRFYRLTGDTRFLARIPEALDWLQGLALPPGAARRPGETHPTFVEVGTNRPLYVHRQGSNVVNGRYYVDYSPDRTPAHYNAFRRLDVAGLRTQYRAVAGDVPSRGHRGLTTAGQQRQRPAAAILRGRSRRRPLGRRGGERAQRAGLLAGPPRLHQPSLYAARLEGDSRRRLLADARRRRDRHLALSRRGDCRHFHGGVHPAHERTHPGAR